MFETLFECMFETCFRKVLQNDTAGVEKFLGKMINHIDLGLWTLFF